MEKVSTIGLDVAKHVFQVHGVDAEGAVVVRRKLRRLPIARQPIIRGGLQNPEPSARTSD